MSDNDTPKAKGGWTDKERLTYLFALIDNSNVKFDYNTTPRPAGRSVIACQRMLERMKTTLKTELEVLQGGTPIAEGTPKTPRKRKATAAGDVDGTPTKRGRKKKSESEIAAKREGDGDGDDDNEEKMRVKLEVKEEDGGFEDEV